jgi:hypothetical protein
VAGDLDVNGLILIPPPALDPGERGGPAASLLQLDIRVVAQPLAFAGGPGVRWAEGAHSGWLSAGPAIRLHRPVISVGDPDAYVLPGPLAQTFIGPLSVLVTRTRTCCPGR